MVRYADDAVYCFQYGEDAKVFYEALKERLKQFDLEVTQEKTKFILLSKGNDDESDDDGNRDNQGNSFDFLGFTHYVGKDRNGKMRVKRKTSKKKYKASLLRCKEWIKKNRHMPTKELMKKVCIKLHGYIRYYGLTDNRYAVRRFIDDVKKLLFKWLNRRSQRRSFNWAKFNLFLEKYPLPSAIIYVRIFDIGASYISNDVLKSRMR